MYSVGHTLIFTMISFISKVHGIKIRKFQCCPKKQHDAMVMFHPETNTHTQWHVSKQYEEQKKTHIHTQQKN